MGCLQSTPAGPKTEEARDFDSIGKQGEGDGARKKRNNYEKDPTNNIGNGAHALPASPPTSK